MSIMVVFFIILAAVLVIGWIPLGIGGIVALKKKKSAAGIAMSVIAGLWCFVALFIIFFGIIGWLAYQRVEETKNIETFNPATYKGQTGKIKLDGWDGEAQLQLRSSNGKLTKHQTKNGILILPTGQHKISYISLIKKSNDNKSWTASVSPGSWKNPFKINVEENQTAIFPTGSPFNVKITSSKRHGKYTFSLSMKDKAGHKTTIYGIRRTKPAVQIIDDKEKIIWEKNLEYG